MYPIVTMDRKTILTVIFALCAAAPRAFAFDDLRDFMGVDLEEAKRQAEIEMYKYYQPVQGQEVDTWPLKQKKRCVLKAVARKKGVQLDDKIPAPEVYLGSRTSLEVFQDVMEKSYAWRPSAFINVYVDTENIIFLTDDPKLYQNGRTAEDSLAHEYVHYLQVKYEGATRESNQDALEAEAVHIQHWFREKYMSGDEPVDACAEPKEETPGCLTIDGHHCQVRADEPQCESIDGYHCEDPPHRGGYEIYSPDGWHIEHYPKKRARPGFPDGYHAEKEADEDPGCESIDGYHCEPPPRKGRYETYSPDGWHIEYHFVPDKVEEYSPDGWHKEYR